MDNVWIDNNLLSGGHYTIYVRKRTSGAPTNVVIRDNIFIRDSWDNGPFSIDVPVTWTNNQDENGNPITLSYYN